MNDLRERLAIFRIKSGKSLKTIAQETEISYSSLTKFNQGTQKLSNDNINKLVTYLSSNK